MPEERINHYRSLLKRLKRNQGNYRGAPKHEIVALVNDLRGSGWRLKEVCAELGLAKHTIYSWRRAVLESEPRPADNPSSSFLPVVPEEEEPPPRPDADLRILSPAGYSLSGLSLEDAVLAMRSLP